WAGAAYLLYLGVSAWRSARGQAADRASASADAGADAAVQEAGAAQSTGSRWALYRKGFLVGIGNPKDLLFFSALFPQFMDARAPIAMQMVMLGATWMVLDGSIMFAYALCGAKAMARWGRGGAGQWFHRVTGGAFIAAAGVLATTQR
ncbi:MAG: LysE family translocator, partial [Comamonas sp.]